MLCKKRKTKINLKTKHSHLLTVDHVLCHVVTTHAQSNLIKCLCKRFLTIKKTMNKKKKMMARSDEKKTKKKKKILGNDQGIFG